MLHNDSFKLRYFVLARVPHATVLIYYAQKCMDEEHILGYIDLRKVTAVRTEIKVGRGAHAACGASLQPSRALKGHAR